MSARRIGHRGGRGQSAVEFSLILPVLMTLFLGVWSAGELIAARQAADHAMRAGARLAAQVGPDGYPASTPHSCQSDPADPCGVDQQILQAMLPVLAGMPGQATVHEIDIYQPADCSGGPCPPDDGGLHGSDPVDRYTVAGGVPCHQSTGYPLSMRRNDHPFETVIGVQVTFRYASPGLAFFSTTQTMHATVRITPLVG